MRACFSRCLLAACLAVVFSAANTASAQDDEGGFKPLFDGKSLKGWDGNPDFWSVADGAITGQTTAEKPTNGNTFITWTDGEVDDFELRLKFRIVGGNSGIQYRSKLASKWVIGGYQADFDGGNGWTGTLYEERGRGVLAKRGTKVVRTADGKNEEKPGDVAEKDIVDSVKKEDWNDYTVIAQGNHLIHKVNGKVTVDFTDNEEAKRVMSGLLSLQLHAGPPMTVQFKDIRIKRLKLADNRKKVVLIAGRPSHGFGSHEHYAGSKILCDALNASKLPVLATLYKNGWPEDSTALDNADAIVMYCDGGGGHMVVPHLEKVAALQKKGLGVTCIHYAVEVTTGPPGESLLAWLGGFFEVKWSVNPHWTAEFNKFPEHPITRGVKPFTINDEWYYHMRFRPDMKNVTPILSATPPDSTRGNGGNSSDRGGNPAVFARKGMAEVTAWANEAPEGGRGFGFTGGHVHWNWGNDQFRKLVLNAVYWTAQGEVPSDGVTSKSLTADDLIANQDEQPPANFDKAGIEKMLSDWNAAK